MVCPMKKLLLTSLLFTLSSCLFEEEKFVEPQDVYLLSPMTLSFDFGGCYGGSVLKNVRTSQSINIPHKAYENCDGDEFDCTLKFHAKVHTLYNPTPLSISRLDYDYIIQSVNSDPEGNFYLKLGDYHFGKDQDQFFGFSPFWRPVEYLDNNGILDTVFATTFEDMDSIQVITREQLDSLNLKILKRLRAPHIEFKLNYVEPSKDYDPNCKLGEFK